MRIEVPSKIESIDHNVSDYSTQPPMKKLIYQRNKIDLGENRMKYFIYMIIILLFSFITMNVSTSQLNECNYNYNFSNNSDLFGWNGIKTLAGEVSAPTIFQNEEINISVMNCADWPGLIRFNYSILGDFCYNCKLSFSIDGIETDLPPQEVVVRSQPYVVEEKNGKNLHYITWNFSCSENSQYTKDRPRCVLDDIIFSDIKMIPKIPDPKEITFDPSDKDLNDKINKTSKKIIKLKEGLHVGPISIAGAEGITLEPETNRETGKYVDVTLDGNDSDHALKLINSNDITLDGIIIRNANKTLIIQNSSNFIIKNLIIKDFDREGVSIIDCSTGTNRIEYNKISSELGETIAFNLKNSNSTIINRNKIYMPMFKYHYNLDKSYDNMIYLFGSSFEYYPISINGLDCFAKINSSDSLHEGCFICAGKDKEIFTIYNCNSKDITKNSLSIEPIRI
jgi:hypothetical protein